MANALAEIQFHSAFKQNKHQRQRTQKLSKGTELIGIHPFQEGAEHQSGDQQDPEIGDARNAKQSVRDKREQQEAADQAENLDLAHTPPPREWPAHASTK